MLYHRDHLKSSDIIILNLHNPLKIILSSTVIIVLQTINSRFFYSFCINIDKLLINSFGLSSHIIIDIYFYVIVISLLSGEILP